MLTSILIKELWLMEKGLVIILDLRELEINATKLTTPDTYVNNIKAISCLFYQLFPPYFSFGFL